MATINAVKDQVVKVVIGEGGEAFQKEIMDKKIAGEKMIRKALGKLVEEKRLFKVKTKSGAFLFKLPGNPEEAAAKVEVVNNTEEQEMRAAFLKLGMTKDRASLMAHQVIQGKRTEIAVINEWKTNPANKASVPAPKGSDPTLNKLKALNDEAKEKRDAKAEKAKIKKVKAPSGPTKLQLFEKMLKEKAPITMKEVKVADWNDRNATFYDHMGRLEKDGLAYRVGKLLYWGPAPSEEVVEKKQTA